MGAEGGWGEAFFGSTRIGLCTRPSAPSLENTSSKLKGSRLILADSGLVRCLVRAHTQFVRFVFSSSSQDPSGIPLSSHPPSSPFYGLLVPLEDDLIRRPLLALNKLHQLTLNNPRNKLSWEGMLAGIIIGTCMRNIADRSSHLGVGSDDVLSPLGCPQTSPRGRSDGTSSPPSAALGSVLQDTSDVAALPSILDGGVLL